MKKTALIAIAAVAVGSLAGCAVQAPQEKEAVAGNPFTTPSFQSIIKNDFTATGQAGLDRLDQTPRQEACSKYAYLGQPMPADMEKKFEAEAQAKVVEPADGHYMGDWKEGLKIAQDGKGLQWSDKPGAPNGGNCFACHEMVKNDPSQGTLGPSLVDYAKTHGTSDAIVKYTWARLYNSAAMNACSFMPPFGAHKILTEAQMKDVMALLLDAKSPVNQ